MHRQRNRSGIHGRLAPAVVLCAVGLCLGVSPVTPALAQKASADKPDKAALAKAATFFEEGQALYNKGRYAEAIMSFKAAHHTAPHPSALFNIARCYENLADPVEALSFYQLALKETTDEASKKDIEGRIQRLQIRPTKVFVSTVPPGATVTVDGREKPEPTPTPMVVHLTPGEHLLLLHKEGFHLAAKRVVVELGKEQPQQVKLKALPAACPPVKECPAQKKCPELKLTDTYKLHMNLSILGAFGFQHDRPVSGGPGLWAYLNIKNALVGPSFFFFPGGELSIDTTLVTDVFEGASKVKKTEKYTEAELRWILAMVEAGYAFTFDTSYLYVVGGLGISLDQVIYKGTETKTVDGKDTTRTISITKQEGAFAWVVGGGVEAFATKWLSVGAAFRFGLIHGTRLDAENPGQTDNGSTFPFGTVWGTVTLHL